MPRSVGGGGESGKEPVALLPPTQAKQKQPARGGHRDWAILFSHSLRLAKNSCKVTEVRTAAALGGGGAGRRVLGKRCGAGGNIPGCWKWVTMLTEISLTRV